MGTFPGHALPGAFFCSWALWWASQIPRRAVLCRRTKKEYFTSVTYPFPECCCCSCPLEAIIKVTATSVGMAGELFAATDYGHVPGIVYWGDVQHVTMYLFFCLSGIVDILRSRGTFCVPQGLDYLVAALAFAVECLLFSNHLHGRSQLDTLLHTLLLYAIACTVFVILLESYFDESIVLSLTRAALTLLQGTWFIQVGFILYPPTPTMHRWDESSDDSAMMAVMVFCWHVAGAFIIVLVLFALLTKCYNNRFTTRELDLDNLLSVECDTDSSSERDDGDSSHEISIYTREDDTELREIVTASHHRDSEFDASAAGQYEEQSQIESVEEVMQESDVLIPLIAPHS